MEKGLQGLQKEWEFIRNCSKTFIKELSDTDLDRKLPRKGLDTIRKHFQEMIEVQIDHVDAIGTNVMEYNSCPDTHIDGNLSKEKMLNRMDMVDKDLSKALEAAHEGLEVEWFGQKQLLPYHLSAMICHESMHIGQIIAFCYVLDIEIPKFVRESWALSGK